MIQTQLMTLDTAEFLLELMDGVTKDKEETERSLYTDAQMKN